MKNANDNEPPSFQSLGLATAIVLNRIRNAQTLLDFAKQKQEKPCDEGKRRDPKEQDPRDVHEEERRYVTHRLQEIAEWERRISGNKS